MDMEIQEQNPVLISYTFIYELEIKKMLEEIDRVELHYLLRSSRCVFQSHIGLISKDKMFTAKLEAHAISISYWSDFKPWMYWLIIGACVFQS